MSDRFLAVWTAIGELVANPTANLTASVLLLAALTLILLIFALGALLWVMSSGEREVPIPIEHRLAEEPVEEMRAAGLSRTVLWVVLALVFASALSGYVFSGRDDYCLSCHEEIGLPATAGESTGTVEPVPSHAGAHCVECHERAALPLGFVGNGFERIEHLIAGNFGGAPVSRPVDSARCVACHDTVIREVIEIEERGLLVSHAEPFSAGMACAECHPGVPHAPDAVDPGMAVCVRCHDGEQTASACATCHTGDPSDATAGRPFPPQRLVSRTDCGGCHAQETCDACHGLRMPHSEAFEAYDHARYAGFDLKESCWRCHTIGDCDACHETKAGIWGHGTGDTWRTQHAMPGSPDPGGCGCHAAHPSVRDQGDFCIACH